ncbi:unnamed protein product, partial [Allacma fusca]
MHISRCVRGCRGVCLRYIVYVEYNQHHKIGLFLCELIYGTNEDTIPSPVGFARNHVQS